MRDSISTAILLTILLLYNHAHSVLIYTANYEGNITVLSLTHNAFASTGSQSYVENGYFAGHAPHKKYTLSMLSTFPTPAKAPQWLTLNHHNNILYLIDGTTTGNGTVTAYRTSSKNGTLAQLDSVECLLDGAFATFYANGKGLAVAHYTSSAIQTYDISAANGKFMPLQTFTFTMKKHGPGTRQNAPHIHQTLTDPSGSYILAMDLGADLVRVYAINEETLLLEQRPSLKAASGSGPRHAVFSQEPILFPDGIASYIFYLGAELAGTITAYRVRYLPSQGGMHFQLLEKYSSLEPGISRPAGIGDNGITAELQVSPDGNFLIVSNRFDERFNGTKEQYPPNGKSDSISTFRIRQDLSGRLDFVQAAPAGGYVARAMDVNKAGDLAVVGLQEGERVAILERDLGSGVFREQVATIDIPGQTWATVWDE